MSLYHIGRAGLNGKAAWQSMQSWRGRQKAFNSQITGNGAGFFDRINSALLNESQGAISIVSQEATVRVKKQASDAQARLADTKAQLNDLLTSFGDDAAATDDTAADGKQDVGSVVDVTA